MSYNKLATSKTLEVKEGLGLILELTEGRGNNVLSLWLQYKDAETGDWKHKSTKGANAIRLPISETVIDFIKGNLDSIMECEKRYTSKPKIDKDVNLKSLTKEQLLTLLAEIDKPKEEEVKKEDVLDISFAEFAKLTKREQQRLVKQMSK